jgi:copper chaperone
MLKSITLEVIGDQRIACEGCEQRIESLLQALPGVGKVRARARDQRIEVLFDAATLEATTIGQRLSEAGYETRVSGSTSDSANPQRSVPGMATQNRRWLRSLALIPGVLLSLAPSATCPACLAGYAGLLSAVGLGVLLHERLLTPLIVVFLVVGIASMAWSTRGHGRLGPFVATLMGSAAIVMGRFIGHVHIVLYVGVGLLIGASFWNLWLKRPRREPLVQIGATGNEGTSRFRA